MTKKTKKRQNTKKSARKLGQLSLSVGEDGRRSSQTMRIHARRLAAQGTVSSQARLSWKRESLGVGILVTYLSLLKSVMLDPASHALGHLGDSVTSGQPGVPSAGYGSLPTGPWWWQCGREKSEQSPLPNGPVLWYLGVASVRLFVDTNVS
jgi:hypothetical protein